MMKHATLAAAFAAAAAIIAGCSRQQAPEPQEPNEPTVAPEDGMPPIDPVEALAIEADELFFKGETNAVVERFTAALDDEQFADHRPRVFNALLRFLLETDQLEEAQKRMDALYAARDFDLARAGFGQIFFHLNGRGLPDDAGKWMDHTLEVEGLPAGMRMQGIEWSMSLRLRQGDVDGACDRAAELAAGFPDNAAEIISRACDRLFADGELDKVERLSAVLAAAQPQPAQAAEVALAIKVRLLAARGDWDMARETFVAAAGSLSDQRLQLLLRGIVREASKNRKNDFVDAVCSAVIDSHADKPTAFSQACRLWIENAAANAPAELPARLSGILERGAQPSQVCTLFMRTFYNTTRDEATLVAMIDLGRSLDQVNDDEDIRTFIRTSVVDGSFILGKYDTAIEMLEKGIPGRDEQWTRMALSKVRAHKALYDEDWRDAVKYFREFMAAIAGAKDEDTIDPESQVRHTKNMILGRNAKRIGDILLKIPDEAAAAEAYAEARDYYAKARAECEGDDETLAIIGKEEAELP